MQVARRGAAAAILGLSALGPANADAEERVRGARLAVHFAETGDVCPSEADLATRVRDTAPDSTSDREPADGADGGAGGERIEVIVSVFRDETGLIARVAVTGRRAGQRELRAATCAGLADGLVVLIGMVLDEAAQAAREAAREESEEAATRAAPPPPAEALPTGVPEPPTPSAPAPREDPPRPRAPSPSAGGGRAPRLRGLAAAGISSELGEGVFAGLELGVERWSLRALAALRLPREVDFGPGRLESLWVGAVAAGCGQTRGAIRGLACLHGWAGSLHVRARGFSETATSERPWAALGASAGVVTGDRIRLGAEVIGLAPLLQDRFHVLNVEGAWNAGRPVAWLVAHAAVEFF